MAIIDKVLTDDFTMEYCKFGNGSKNLVIIPGISITSVVANADAVEAQFSTFCDDFTVYLFDRKLAINSDYSIQQMADDTARAMELLGIDNACVYGASQGGMIAQCIAITYPHLVSRIVLASTLSRTSEELQASLDSWLTLAKKGNARELVEFFIDNVYSKETLDSYREIMINQFKDVPEENLNQFYYLAKGTIGFDVYDELSRIKCPVLVVGGRLDKVLGIQGTIDIAERLNCDCFIYDDYCHAVYDEAPDFRERMYKFFS